MEEGEGGWGVGLNNQVLAQLDCCLVSDDWEGNFHGVLQYLLPRPVLDHAPILLDGGCVCRGPSPFRFENMWRKEEDFKELVKSWWMTLNFRGSLSFDLVEKLKSLTGFLKRWNTEVFRNVTVKNLEALSQVEFWDSKEA